MRSDRGNTFQYTHATPHVCVPCVTTAPTRTAGGPEYTRWQWRHDWQTDRLTDKRWKRLPVRLITWLFVFCRHQDAAVSRWTSHVTSRHRPPRRRSDWKHFPILGNSTDNKYYSICSQWRNSKETLRRAVSVGILSTTMFWMKPAIVMMGAVGATVGSGRGCGGERWCFKEEGEWGRRPRWGSVGTLIVQGFTTSVNIKPLIM